MRDPYTILGVGRDADAAAIKSAFRKLAKKHHPDANANDPKAAARFSELNAAYEIVGDEKKRAAFDRGEIDAEGKPRFQGFEGMHPGAGGQGGFESFSFGNGGFRRGGGGGRFGGIDEILREAMGGFASARRGGGSAGGGAQFEPEDFAHAQGGGGQDVAAALTVTLHDLAHGASKRVHLPTGKEIDVKIPQGIADKQTIRLKGQGMPGPGGRAGDALVTITIAKHPYFERDDLNLRLDLPVTLYEAVLGGKVRVPTLDGAVELAIPPDTNGGRTFRLKGKGLPGKSGNGDLLATIRIVLPEGSDAELEELMRQWRDSKAYDPRRDIS